MTFAFGITLSGCNTMAGAGQDIQKGGAKIENAAEKKN
ncbi:entericidin A/B family lipoprotein [Variovorax sp. PAMC 28711]